MQFGASHPAALSSRLSTLGLVIALHVLIVLGLGAGLIGGALKTPPAPLQVDLPTQLPPPEPESLPLPRQALPDAPPVQKVPLPEVPPVSDVQPPISVQPTTQFDGAVDLQPRAAASGSGSSGAEQPTAQSSNPVSAGLLCPTQARPELPALAQSGSAHLRVLGTVRGGRVVAVQMSVLQALPDRRAHRALLAGVEQTLRSGYVCTQDGQFEQEFLFRVTE
jgi:hypothetical protein